ncbi:MAG: hypothetical protein ACK53Y_26305, partial [bacterium]
PLRIEGSQSYGAEYVCRSLVCLPSKSKIDFSPRLLLTSYMNVYHKKKLSSSSILVHHNISLLFSIAEVLRIVTKTFRSVFFCLVEPNRSTN